MTTSKRRIKRPKHQEEIYKTLVDTDEFGIFTTYKDIFMLAGVLGYMENKRVQFSGSAEGITWNIFNLETDEATINAIALAVTENVEILRDDDESFNDKLTIFEELAAGGVEIIQEKIMIHPKTASNAYFELLLSMENHMNDKERSLKGIADMLSF